MNSATRNALRAKARLGRWDSRYLNWYDGIPHVLAGKSALRKTVMRAYGKHGLVVTATTNGKHSPTSYHALGRAVDFGLVRKEIGTATGRRRLLNFQRSEFNAWSRGHRTGLMELIGPDNDAVVLRGRHTPLAEGTALENQHDNHVHAAY